jgi:hypothetical protein
MRDIGRYKAAEQDYLLARRLFPNSRYLDREEMALALGRGATLFEAGEVGSPESLAEELALQSGRSVSPTLCVKKVS